MRSTGRYVFLDLLVRGGDLDNFPAWVGQAVIAHRGCAAPGPGRMSRTVGPA